MKPAISIEDFNLSEEEMKTLVSGAQRWLPPEDNDTQTPVPDIPDAEQPEPGTGKLQIRAR